MLTDRTAIRRFFAGLLVAVGALDIVEALIAPHWLRTQVVESLLPAAITVSGRTGIVIAGLGLMLLATGIARGKRVAWQLTLAVLVASVVLHLAKDLDLEDALLDAWVSAGLYWLRRHFQAQSDPAGLRRGLASLAAGLGLSSAYAVVGSWLLRAEMAPGFPLRHAAYHALTERASWFLNTLPVIAGGLVLLSLVEVLRPTLAPAAAAGERRRLRELIARCGHNPVCHLALHGPLSFFWASGGGCVAYAVRGRVAIALGDPIACPEDQAATGTAFLAFCDRQGWTGAFYQVEADRPYAGMGLTMLPVGADAIVPTASFSLAGGERASLRYAVRHCERLGVRVTLLAAPDAKAAAGDEMAEISGSWLAGGKGPEMGFSLGTLATLDDPAITVALARDAEGRLEGFVSWLPVPARRGWTLDLMRRRPDGPRGVMETLIVRSIEEARSHGIAEVSLGLAPLAITSGGTNTLTDRVLRHAYERLDRFRRSRSLRQFKSKFAPVWEQRYLAVAGAATLPEVLVALLRVHLPPLSAISIQLRLGRSSEPLRRRPRLTV